MGLKWLMLLWIHCVIYSQSLEHDQIAIIILSQPNTHHAQLARQLKQDILQQANTINKDLQLVVHLSHIDFPHVGGWTVIPLISKLAALHGDNSSFVFFVEDSTSLRLRELLTVLDKYKQEEAFIGFALHDNEPSIIHHFAFYDNPGSFKYPNMASGFAISTPLLKRLGKKHVNTSKTDFNIDNSYELALFIWDEGRGVSLTHEPQFCISEGAECVSHPRQFTPCRKPVAAGVYFAVKTCRKFHADRVKVVKETWAKQAEKIKFFSDVEDNAVPTTTLGIPNMEHGHCEKTFSIIKHVAADIVDMDVIKWIVIADDDTILSVSKLQMLLSCYDSSELIALGERYGYGVLSPLGYNYITGGGSIVLSRPLLELLADPNNCNCPSPSTPDDMYLGFCLMQLEIPITHSPLFHQARPADYASGYLKSHSAVSFHKHWMLDPFKVYKTWFGEKHTHNEL